MIKNPKYSLVEIIIVVCCTIGCLLLIAPKFIDTELDLFSIGIAFNGVGIMALLFGRKPGKVD